MLLTFVCFLHFGATLCLAQGKKDDSEKNQVPVPTDTSLTNEDIFEAWARRQELNPQNEDNLKIVGAEISPALLRARSFSTLEPPSRLRTVVTP